MALRMYSCSNKVVFAHQNLTCIEQTGCQLGVGHDLKQQALVAAQVQVVVVLRRVQTPAIAKGDRAKSLRIY